MSELRHPLEIKLFVRHYVDTVLSNPSLASRSVEDLREVTVHNLRMCYGLGGGAAGTGAAWNSALDEVMETPVSVLANKRTGR